MLCPGPPSRPPLPGPPRCRSARSARVAVGHVGAGPLVTDADEVDLGRIIERIEQLHRCRTNEAEYVAGALSAECLDGGLTARKFGHVSVLFKNSTVGPVKAAGSSIRPKCCRRGTTCVCAPLISWAMAWAMEWGMAWAVLGQATRLASRVAAWVEAEVWTPGPAGRSDA